MPFQMKIQPIDYQSYGESVNYESPATVTAKPVLKSRLKRLFDRQFPSVLKNNLEKTNGAGEGKDGEFEPSSVCLAKMVQNFIEDTAPEKPKCGRNRCNCFNGNINDISDDEFDLSAVGFFGDSTNPNSWSGDSSETLKSLTPCATVAERNLLADTSKIVEKNKICKWKDELRRTVADGLLLIGYDASICKSRWEKSPSYPAGEYEYLDVILEGGVRVLIDIDFRSEFEIARPTGNYKAILQSLPYIFVGQADRLQQILSIVSEAAKLSLKKKGMHIPPWRKFEYMSSKWLSAHTRTPPPPPPTPSLLPPSPPTPPPTPDSTATASASKQLFSETEKKSPSVSTAQFECECGVFELIFGEETTPSQTTETSEVVSTGVLQSDDGFDSSSAAIWQPPAIKPRNSKLVVTGLASLFREKA